MTLDLVGPRRWFFLASAIIVLLSLVMLAVFGLRPGIEFTSGSTMLVQFNGGVDQTELRSLYAGLGHSEARVQSTGQNQYLIRTSELEVPPGSFTEVAPEAETDFQPVGPQPLEELGTLTIGAESATDEVLLRQPFQDDPCNFGAGAGTLPAGTEASVVATYTQCGEGDDLVYQVASGDALGLVRAADTRDFVPVEEPEAPAVDQGEKTLIENALRERFGEFEVLEFASVSAVVSEVAVRNAAIAVVIAGLFIMGYVAFAFATVPKPFRYATCAIVATVHDVVVVLGAFALFGQVFGMEINLMFVTALLTVIGFSVHDTIVTFDRIRENTRLQPNAPVGDNVNAALVQTLTRSLNTSTTLLLTVVAMILLGGVTIREFLLVIIVGVVAGVYSSVAIAAQMLVSWEEGDFDRWFRRGRRRSSEAGQVTS
ncbi:MAG: protein translocase subunit SecF [Dehalococcoidia bacterium]|nr:protein translocase subunit SecF [Dehalococcoidia bacterium]